MNEQLDVKKLLANSPTNNRGFSIELKSRINGRVAAKRVRKGQFLRLLPVVNALIAVVLVGGVVQFAHHSLIRDHLSELWRIAQGCPDKVQAAQSM